MRKVFSSQPTLAAAIACPVWLASVTVIRKLQAGEEVHVLPILRLAEDIKTKCGKSVEEFQANCGPNARDILAKAYTAVYAPNRRKRMSDNAIRIHLIEAAEELERLARTRESKDANVRLIDLCEQVHSMTRAVRPIRAELQSLAAD